MKPIRFGQKVRHLPGTPRGTQARTEAQGSVVSRAAREVRERQKRERETKR